MCSTQQLVRREKRAVVLSPRDAVPSVVASRLRLMSHVSSAFRFQLRGPEENACTDTRDMDVSRSPVVMLCVCVPYTE
jgi:hypothetical protein